jgi:hypothetical protein
LKGYEGRLQNLDKLRALIMETDNLTAAQWSNIYAQRIIRKDATYIVNDVLGVSCLAPLSVASSNMSALYYMLYSKQNGGFLQVINDMEYGPQQYFMEGSFHPFFLKLNEKIIKNGNVFTNSPVTSVTEDQNGVTVSVGANKIRAKKVVVSMAPSSARKINFSSKINNKYGVLFDQKMGLTIKGFLVYDNTWWQNTTNASLSFSGYYGGVRNSMQYQEAMRKINRTDDIFFTWYFDNSLADKNKSALMFFIVGDAVKTVLKQINYNSSWSYDYLIEQMNPVILESAKFHAGFFYNPKFLDTGNDLYKNWPDFRPEAFQTVGFLSGIWFEDTPYIPGGPDTVLKEKLNLYSLFEESPLEQINNNQGIMFSGSEFAPIYTGYLTGALYQGRQAANSILQSFSLPQVPTTYLNAPFPVSLEGLQLFTLPTLQQPDDLNYVLYMAFDRVDSVANKYKDMIVNNMTAYVLCCVDMLATIKEIQVENKIDENQWEWAPYKFLHDLLQSQIPTSAAEQNTSTRGFQNKNLKSLSKKLRNIFKNLFKKYRK